MGVAVGATVGVAWASLVRRTPLVPAPALGEGVLLKLENLQRGGSFKLRGAAVRFDALDAAERARGVVVASAGNHGIGAALAGRALGVRVEVLVPASSPDVKRRAIAELGATVRVVGATYDEAEQAARARAAESGMLFVSAFDDPHVIEGNGARLGAELLTQAPGLARVVVPVGGGGMIGGLAQALAPRGIEVIGVQPAVNSAMHDSLARGAALTTYDGGATLAEGCDGAVAERTFGLCRDHGVRVVLVSEAAIRHAIRFAWERLGQQLEPTGAVGLAGLLAGVVAPHAAPTAVVLSGGNVKPELLAELLAEQLAEQLADR